jgi:hypothetical protein
MPREESSSKPRPLDSEEIFRRLGTAPQVAHEGDPPPLQAGLVPAHSAPDTTSRTPDHEDESIDTYMARLLERSRGKSDRPESEAGPEDLPAEEVQPRRQTPSVPATPLMPVHARPSTPVNLSPRTVAPERLSDLSAMRELANISAHAALDRHVRGTLIRTTRMKLLVAACGLLAGGVTFWAWWFRQTMDLLFYSALVCFLVTLVWGVQYALLASDLIARRSRHLRSLPRGRGVDKVVPSSVRDRPSTELDEEASTADEYTPTLAADSPSNFPEVEGSDTVAGR